MRKNTLFLSLLILVLTACSQDVHERYTKPDWLEGDIVSILKNDGDYSIFLEGLNRAGYLEQVSGRSNLTVFAPNDAAFEAYFTKKQITGLDGIQDNLLKKLITYHLVQNTYTKDRLTELFEEPIVRLPTLYRDDPEEVVDVHDEKTKLLFKYNKWVPLFHNTRFELANVSNPTANFNYFFDNTYEEDAIYYGNAKIVEYEIPAENGYLYKINEVVEPLDNIYDILKRSPEKHSYFLTMLDGFRYYFFDQDITDKFGGVEKDSLFRSVYLFDAFKKNLANEENFLGDYSEMHNFNINAFIPYDASLKLWLEQNVLNEDYPTLDDLSLISKKYILNYFISEDEFSFPERIDGAKVLNSYNIPMTFPTDTSVGECASNGVYYGLTETPDILFFNTVLKIPFTEKDYQVYLYLLENSGSIPLYLNKNIDYTTFIPHNNAWDELGFSIDYGDPLIIGDEIFSLVENDEDRPLNRTRLSSLVGYHTLTGKFNFSDNIQIVSNQNKFGVTFIRGTNVWSGGNEEIGLAPELIEESIEVINGKSYKIDIPVMSPTKDLAYHIALNSERYKEFIDLITSIDGFRKNSKNEIIGLAFLKSGKYTCYIPSNEAIIQAKSEGKIPAADGDLNKELKAWLSYFFVNSATDLRENYFLPNEGLNQWMESAAINDPEAETFHLLKVISGAEYKVIGANNEEAKVNIEAATVGRNGLLYEIDKVISFK